MHTDVSGIGIESVRTEAVMTRSSRIGLGRVFEPLDGGRLQDGGAVAESHGGWRR